MRMLLIIMRKYVIIVLQPDATILAPNVTKGRYFFFAVKLCSGSPLYFAGRHEEN